MAKRHYDHQHRKAREVLLADDPLCVHCVAQGAEHPEPAEIADHDPPLALHDHVDGSDCCVLQPSCRRHSYEQAGQVSTMLRRAEAKGLVVTEVTFDEPDPTPGPDDPMWDADWMADLLELPDDATWPRFQSALHPAATGSHGAEFEQWCSRVWGIELRWWQRLVARRLLEHDWSGRLVHLEALFSVARQLGKSVLGSLLLIWTTINVRRFWPSASDVLLTSRTLASAEAMMKEGMRWAERETEWRTRKVNGQHAMIYASEFELMIRSLDSVYGETAGLVLVDEIWDVKETSVSEGLQPVVLDTEGSMFYTTTAHRKATSLSLNMRSRAFEHLEDPSNDEGLLIIEWSTPRDYAIDDVEGWRLASPHWTRFRQRLIAMRLKSAQSGAVLDHDEPDPIEGFRSQYLNQFPIRQTRRGPGEPLFDTGAWASTLVTGLVPQFNRVVAVEDNYGFGLAVTEAGVSADERIAVRGVVFEDRDEGWEFAKRRHADRYLISGTLGSDPHVRDLTNVSLRGGRELRGSLSLLRSLVNRGQVTHDGGPDMAEQMLACRVRQGSAGLAIATHKIRHDLVHGAAWSVAEVHEQRGIAPSVR